MPLVTSKRYQIYSIKDKRTLNARVVSVCVDPFRGCSEVAIVRLRNRAGRRPVDVWGSRATCGVVESQDFLRRPQQFSNCQLVLQVSKAIE